MVALMKSRVEQLFSYLQMLKIFRQATSLVSKHTESYSMLHWQTCVLSQATQSKKIEGSHEVERCCLFGYSDLRK